MSNKLLREYIDDLRNKNEDLTRKNALLEDENQKLKAKITLVSKDIDIALCILESFNKRR